MKYDHIPADKRKKILLLSDDMRTNSGIATIARELVVGTSHRFNWVQAGGLINHPDKGKIFDLSQATNDQTGITDSSVKIYPVDGYGNPDIVRQLLGLEKPDVILHFTDPRFWIWLYEMEHEIREMIPLTYLNIWDDLPYPMWNKPFYESCDSLFSISKQTYNLNKFVLGEGNYVTKDDLEKKKPFNHLVHYVPHGVNEKVFRKITADDVDEEAHAKLVLFKKELFGDKKYEFVLFYNSRNIHRKHPSDIILGYKHFCDTIGEEAAKKVVLLMHTQPQDEAGTDLVSVKNALCPDYDVVFSNQRIEPEKMNFLYNIADVNILISSNEGFGISGVEALMSETPIIANVTGGMQDYCGFVDDSIEGSPEIEFTFDWGSNHDARYTKHGKWAYAIFPSNRSLQGSIATPYIFDDRVAVEDISEGIFYWYKAGKNIREEAGALGRKFAIEQGFNAEFMSGCLIDGLETTLKHWTPRKKFDLYKVTKPSVKSGGFKLKEIDKSKIESKLNSNWKQYGN